MYSWRKGASADDGLFLSLIHISLLSFHENLTDVEITELIQEMDKMFSAEGYEKTYQWTVNIIKDYPCLLYTSYHKLPFRQLQNHPGC